MMSKSRSVVGLLALSLVHQAPLALTAQEPQFVRGDVNQNGELELADSLAVLLHLYSPSFTARCEKAADANDDGLINLADAIFGLEHLFRDGPPPPAPGDRCGVDPTPDALGCDQSPCSDYGAIFRLSEVMASNTQSLLDEDGDTPDWIEIEMLPGAPSVVMDLGGWHLTDDLGDLTKWRFPDGVVLGRGGFKVVFASGKDRAVAGSELHTGFKLGSSGDVVALVAPDGATVVDQLSIVFPPRATDLSYGRVQAVETWVATGATALYHVPTGADVALGENWAAPGFPSAGWKSGATGLGFSSGESSEFLVTCIKANVEVDDIDVARSVLSDPSRQVWVATGTASVIDYRQTGESGNYPNDLPFPGIIETETEIEDFVVHITGKVVLPSSGAWTFGVNSDDGFHLELAGGGASFAMEQATQRGAADTVARFTIPQAGTYDLDLLYFQRSGDAELELFASKGIRLTFNADTFDLVGDTEAGGLALQGLAADVATDVSSDMLGASASLWARIPFDVTNADVLGALTLRMKYEDGFVAYLNGLEVARRNAPRELGPASASVLDRSIGRALVFEDIDLTDLLDKLVDGANVLAVHGLNDSADDGAFLILPELRATRKESALNYMRTPTPGAANEPGALGFVRDVTFSVEHGFFSSPFSLELATETAGAQVRYTLDGSTPTASTGAVYSTPLALSKTTTLRAAAFKESHLEAPVLTQTYLFPADVVLQSPSGQAPGPGWPTGTVNRQVLNYGMDPDIVNSPEWGGQVQEALLAIPTISLVTDLPNLFGPTTGIYVNPGNDGRAWERRTSMELIQPDGTPGFSQDVGLRIRGAFSRTGNNPKHSLRVLCRSEYGADKISYPLFGGEGSNAFKRMDLRTSQNYSWAFEGSSKNTFLRDVFSRDVQKAMGQPYSRSRYYHLYLNGVYWGLYQTEERADADFAETYLGGNDDEYDVVKNDSSSTRALQATDGNMDAYRRLYDAAVAGFAPEASYLKALGLRPDGTPDPAGEALLNPENLMDYMICTYYTGDPDAPVSAWAHFSNNVFAIFNRVKRDGFTWYRHDAEHSLGANGGLNEARLLTDPTDRSIGQEWRHFNPAWLHIRLTANPEYLLQFADRVNRWFFHGGILSSGPNIDRWLARAHQIEEAIVAESARWGDARRNQPFTKTDWFNESSWLTGTYFPQRTQIVLDQMRSVSMFPALGIVSFSQHGGEVASGFALTLSQGNGSAGSIFYTTDGSDPRLWDGATAPNSQLYVEGGGEQPIVLLATATVRARLKNGSSWGALTSARFTVGLARLKLNELMASNGTTLEDPDEPGERPDWVELYNGTAGTVDLGGMYLTDDPLDLRKWTIATGVSIASGQRLVFYADDDGTQGPLHTSFQLSQDGETIALVDTDGETILDSITFDGQTRDVSYGRFPDGDGPWGFHESPTPGGSNSAHAP